MKTPILLGDSEIADARRLSRDSQTIYAGRSGHYGNGDGRCDNSLRQHFTGKVGEVAVELFFRRARCKVVPLFRMGLDTYSDVGINREKGGIRIEVKTVSARFWKHEGRCVTPEQLPKIRTKADIILWVCSHVPADSKFRTGTEDDRRVDLMGFSTIPDLHALRPVVTGTSRGEGKLNLQLGENNLRGIEQLAEWISTFKFPKRYFDCFHTRFGHRPVRGGLLRARFNGQVGGGGPTMTTSGVPRS